MYSRLLEFVPHHCRLLREVTGGAISRYWYYHGSKFIQSIHRSISSLLCFEILLPLLEKHLLSYCALTKLCDLLSHTLIYIYFVLWKFINIIIMQHLQTYLNILPSFHKESQLWASSLMPLNLSSSIMHISFRITGWSSTQCTVDNVITCLKYAAVLSLLSDKADIVPGYDFLVNSVWPEIIKGIEERLPYLFNPGNPDIFYEVLPQWHSGCWCIHFV